MISKQAGHCSGLFFLLAAGIIASVPSKAHTENHLKVHLHPTPAKTYLLSSLFSYTAQRRESHKPNAGSTENQKPAQGISRCGHGINWSSRSPQRTAHRDLIRPLAFEDNRDCFGKNQYIHPY